IGGNDNRPAPESAPRALRSGRHRRRQLRSRRRNRFRDSPATPDALDRLACGVFRALDVVVTLEIQPALRVGAEKARESQRRIRADAAPFAQDLIDARRGNFQGASQRVAGKPQWFNEVCPLVLARMDGFQFFWHGRSLSVVIDNLDILRQLWPASEERPPHLPAAHAPAPQRRAVRAASRTWLT